MHEHHAPLPVLDNEARAELLSLCRRKVVPAHHAIFRDGDRADHYYNITSGIVKLVKPLADGRADILACLMPRISWGNRPRPAIPTLPSRRPLRLPKSPFRRVHDVAP